MTKNNFFITKNNHTPMIKQYFSIKEKYPNMLLFYQMGDFYELFYEDAKRVSQLLKISLTKKGYSNENIIPMAGVPCHTAEYYLAKLVKMGESIAVCDQVKDIHSEKKLISRQVVRVITPGTVTDEAFLDDNKDNFIACIWKEENKFAYSILDISLGFFGVSEHFNKSSLLAEIERTNPTELLYPECFENISLISHRKCIQKRPLLDFDLKISYNLLKLQFKTSSLDGFGIKKNHFVIRPAGCLLNYVKLMYMTFLPHIRKIKFNYVNNNIFMNTSTRKSLEIVQSTSGDNKNTLSSILNKTITSMGGRLLNRWLNSPSKDLKLIRNRQKMIKNLQPFYKDIQHILNEISDLERISSRLALRTALPRDFVRMRSTLNILPDLNVILKKINSKNINNIRISIGTFKKIFLLLKKSINSTVPSSIRDGGVIAFNYSKKLDALRALKDNSKKYLKDLEIQEKNKLNIDSLKIKFNKIIGYYIQVSKRHTHLIPKFYFKVQTLKRVERYSTSLLKSYEKKVINAESQSLILEKKLYLELFNIIEPYLEKLKNSALALSQLDVLVNLSERAISLKYVCPEIKKKYGISLVNSRHPIVECFLETPFISNSISLSKNNRMIIITGPNMGGKSTYMRQIAIIVIMACIGSFVPAEHASIGLIDHIFTRIGSADDLSNGYSTFMMEMTEISNILNNANCNSLVLIDELGRGTSYKDGLALSWSCCKHLILKNQSMVLLSTHFFELTELESLFKYVKNFYFSAVEHDSNIVFLYKIKKGISRKSYGISVASLSGIPDSVIEDAKLKLIELERK